MSIEHARPERVVIPTSVAPRGDLDPVVDAPLDLPPGAEVRIVGYERYAGGFVPIREIVHHVERTPQRDLAPGPLLDPGAQKMLGGGIGVGAAAAGVGWGIGEAASGVSVGGGLVILAIVVAWKWSARARTVNVHVNQHATGLFGRNHSNPTTHSHR